MDDYTLKKKFKDKCEFAKDLRNKALRYIRESDGSYIENKFIRCPNCNNGVEKIIGLIFFDLFYNYNKDFFILKFLDAITWNAFVEKTSAIDAVKFGMHVTHVRETRKRLIWLNTRTA